MEFKHTRKGQASQSWWAAPLFTFFAAKALAPRSSYLKIHRIKNGMINWKKPGRWANQVGDSTNGDQWSGIKTRDEDEIPQNCPTLSLWFIINGWSHDVASQMLHVTPRMTQSQESTCTISKEHAGVSTSGFGGMVWKSSSFLGCANSQLQAPHPGYSNIRYLSNDWSDCEWDMKSSYLRPHVAFIRVLWRSGIV